MNRKELKVDIDFDEASNEWRKNKINRGKGSFIYKCTYIHKNNKQCHKPLEIYTINNRDIIQDSHIYCRQHAYVIRNNKNK